MWEKILIDGMGTNESAKNKNKTHRSVNIFIYLNMFKVI